jgi:ketosteroid isomerase-like protein
VRRAPIVALLVVVASASACRGESVAVAPTHPVDPGEPAAAPEVDDLGEALAAAVLELYAHLGLGNLGAYGDSLAADQVVALFGVTADAALVGRLPATGAPDHLVFRALGPEILGKNLEVELSRDDAVGWVFDEMSYRVTVDNHLASIPIRQTSAWVRDFDRWVELAEHWSYAVPVDELVRLAKSDALARPRAFKTSPAHYGTEIFDVVARAMTAVGDERAALFAEPARLLVLYPDVELRGDAALAAPPLAAWFGDGASIVVREHRLLMTKSRALAIVVANLAVQVAADGAPVELGLRATYVLERVDKRWRIAQQHVSAGLTLEQLSRRVFGRS